MRRGTARMHCHAVVMAVGLGCLSGRVVLGQGPSSVSAPIQRAAQMHAFVPPDTNATADSIADHVEPFPLMLPFTRPLADAPPVSTLWHFVDVSGRLIDAPIDASLAVQDLIEEVGRLRSVFPWSAADYPGDSLHRLQVARASAWLDRLATRGPALHTAGLSGRQQLALAVIACRAERDTLARHYIDARLADVAKSPVEQAVALVTGVELLADPSHDSARLARNFSIVEAYAERLRALPTTGYHRKGDSVQIAAYQALAPVLLMRAASQLPLVDLLRYVDRFVTEGHALSPELRQRLVVTLFPYRRVATALRQLPNGRAKVEMLNAQLLAMAHRRDTEWPSSMSADTRRTVHAKAEQEIRDSFGAFELLGRPAPPVVANAWLNTPDSLYSAVARTHRFDDGVIRVIAFGERTEPMLWALDRVQRRFPSGVQTVFVTETEGHVGPDLVAPADEVAWLQRLYETTHHATFAIALWAGHKQAQEAPPDEPWHILSSAGIPVQGRLVTSDGYDPPRINSLAVGYQRYLPVPSPVPAAYRLATSHGELVLVDGHGRICDYQPFDTREDEAQLIHRLTALRAQAPSLSTTAPR